MEAKVLLIHKSQDILTEKKYLSLDLQQPDFIYKRANLRTSEECLEDKPQNEEKCRSKKRDKS